MKKAILMICMAVVGLTAIAKPDTTKKVKSDTIAKVVKATKPVKYALNPYKRYHIVLDIYQPQVDAVTGTIDGTLKSNQQLLGITRDAYQKEADYVSHLIRDQISDQQNEDYAKWVADTAAVNKPKPDALKPLKKAKNKKDKTPK